MTRTSGRKRPAKTARNTAQPKPVAVTPIAPIQPPPTSTTLGWILTAYVVLFSGGFAALRSPVATLRGNELSIDRAFFTVINAITLTGFEQAIGLNELTHIGQAAVFVLMTAGTLVSLIAGGMLVTRIVRLPYTDGQITVASLLAVLAAAVIGAVGLSTSTGGILPGVFMGVSALGNSGLTVSRLTDAAGWPTHLILLPFAVAGGLGVPVLLDLYGASIRKQPLSRNSLTVLSASAVVYVVGVVLLLIAQTPRVTYAHPLSDTLVVSSSFALNSRSAGFSLIPIEQLTRSAQWIVMGLMMIGAAPGGTGGGIKVTTPAVLLSGLRKIYRGQLPGRLFSIAAIAVASLVSLVGLGLLFLLNFEPQFPADRLLFLTISAATNTGLSHDPVAIVGSGLYVLGLIALLGRVVPLVVLWWIANTVTNADVAVG